KRKKLLLEGTYAVLAGEGAAQTYGCIKYLRGGAIYSIDFLRVVAIEEDIGVQIAVADMAIHRDLQPILCGDLTDCPQGVGNRAARHRDILAKLGGPDARHGGRDGTAGCPEAITLGGISGDAYF